MKQYDAVIFDWDGTIMDSTQSIVSAIQLACADMQLPVPARERAAWVIGLSLESALYHVAPDLPSDQLFAFVERYKHHFFQNDQAIPLFDGIPEVLSGLKEERVSLAVATGKGRIGLDRVLHASNLTMLFDIIHGLGLEQARVVMVGDTTHDVLMAHNAGIDSIAVSYGAHDVDTLRSAEPTVLVHSVEEMGDWLFGRLVPVVR